MEPRLLGWPDDEGPVEVRRTHLSEVYLGRTRVLKRKRPVNLGFVDFRDRSARAAACEAELRLNRRLAPQVYLGLRELPDGEPAVEMVRLRDEDSLLARLERGELDAATLERVGFRVALFHAGADTSPEIARLGGPDVLRANALENFDQSAWMIGRLVHPDVFARARAATDAATSALAPVLAERAAAGLVRDAHGDLRLEHVYVVDGEVVVIDCIEFADRFRYGDVALDAAFLAMDLEVRSRPDLAAAFWASWERAFDDAESRPLRRLLVSYRSAVRAKVAGITVADPTTAPERLRAQTLRARRHWMLAWSALAAPHERPLLLGVGGRPGSGKSTLARALAEVAGVEVVRSDVVRQGLPEGPGVRYLDDAKDRVYEACFARADAALFAGGRVLVDASFTQARWRDGLAELAARWAVPVRVFRCVTSDAVARERLRTRVGDASEADESVYDRVQWEPGGKARVVDVSRDGPVDEAVDQALVDLLVAGVVGTDSPSRGSVGDTRQAT